MGVGAVWNGLFSSKLYGTRIDSPNSELTPTAPQYALERCTSTGCTFTVYTVLFSMFTSIAHGLWALVGYTSGFTASSEYLSCVLWGIRSEFGSDGVGKKWNVIKGLRNPRVTISVNIQW